MPHPAIEKIKQAAVAAAAVTDQAVRAAVPVVRKVAGDVRDRVNRPDASPAEAAAPAAPAATEPAAPESEAPATSTTSAPSPASIAKNVPHQRPVAKQPAPPKPAPDDVPGGKLPPRR